MMAKKEWSDDELRGYTNQQIQNLFRRAKELSHDPDAEKLANQIVRLDLLKDDSGGLPFDHPIMVEIADICSLPEAVDEAVHAAEKGLPPLAGMEHRIVEALGDKYGTHYTTHHAGRCIADEMMARGWVKSTQKPMPEGTVARSATTFVKRDR